MVIKEQKLMSCADLTDRELRFFSCTLHSAAFMRACTLNAECVGAMAAKSSNQQSH